MVARFQTLFSIVSFTWTDSADNQSTELQRHATNTYEKMKALVLKRYGGLDQVAFADIPRPALKPYEILVQLHAAGLNPIDYMIPKGTFKPMLWFQFDPDGWTHVVASTQGARKTQARPKGVHSRRLGRHWHVRNPTRKTPRSKGWDDHEHG
jgi:hypothetical protein